MAWAEWQPWFGLEDMAIEAMEEKELEIEELEIQKHGYPWETKTGELIYLKDMKTSHIVNAINMIKRSIKANKPWRTSFLKPLLIEYKKRQK